MNHKMFCFQCEQTAAAPVVPEKPVSAARPPM